MDLFTVLWSFMAYSSPVFSVGIIDDFKTWLLEKIQAVVNYIRDFFFDLFKAVTEFIKAMLLTMLDMLKDFFFFIFDALLGLLVTILSGMSAVFSAFDVSHYMTGLPGEVTNIMGLCGLGSCIGMIISALIIRLTLQMIPFTRLGS